LLLLAIVSSFIFLFMRITSTIRQCQWLCGLRRRSAGARLLGSWVRIPLGAWMFVCCECCVLSGRGLCDELITHPEESYRLWCVVVCDLETSRMRRPWPALGRSATAKKKKKTTTIHKRVEVQEGPLKCYGLGPQNVEIQPCVLCLIHINNHKLTSYNAARWLEVAIRNGWLTPGWSRSCVTAAIKDDMISRGVRCIFI